MPAARLPHALLHVNSAPAARLLHAWVTPCMVSCSTHAGTPPAQQLGAPPYLSRAPRAYHALHVLRRTQALLARCMPGTADQVPGVGSTPQHKPAYCVAALYGTMREAVEGRPALHALAACAHTHTHTFTGTHTHACTRACCVAHVCAHVRACVRAC